MGIYLRLLKEYRLFTGRLVYESSIWSFVPEFSQRDK